MHQFCQITAVGCEVNYNAKKSLQHCSVLSVRFSQGNAHAKAATQVNKGKSKDIYKIVEYMYTQVLLT